MIRSIQLSKGIVSPEVSDAFAEAQRKAGQSRVPPRPRRAAPPPASHKRKGAVAQDSAPAADADSGSPSRTASSDDDSGEPDLPARINALDCPEPDEAILEKPVTLRCAVSPKLPIASVTLHYRTPGKDAYDQTEMTKTPKGWFQGRSRRRPWWGNRSSTARGMNATARRWSRRRLERAQHPAHRRGGPAGSGPGRRPRGEDEENPLDEDGRPRSAGSFLGRRDTGERGWILRYGKRRFWVGLEVRHRFRLRQRRRPRGREHVARPELQHALALRFCPGRLGRDSRPPRPRNRATRSTRTFPSQSRGGCSTSRSPPTIRIRGARGAIGAGQAELLYEAEPGPFLRLGMVGGGEGVRFMSSRPRERPRLASRTVCQCRTKTSKTPSTAAPCWRARAAASTTKSPTACRW